MKHTIDEQLKEINKIITYWRNVEETSEYEKLRNRAKNNRELYESIRETLTSVKEKK